MQYLLISLPIRNNSKIADCPVYLFVKSGNPKVQPKRSRETPTGTHVAEVHFPFQLNLGSLPLRLLAYILLPRDT